MTSVTLTPTQRAAIQQTMRQIETGRVHLAGIFIGLGVDPQAQYRIEGDQLVSSEPSVAARGAEPA